MPILALNPPFFFPAPPKKCPDILIQRWIQKNTREAESYRPPIDKISQHFFRNFMEDCDRVRGIDRMVATGSSDD